MTQRGRRSAAALAVVPPRALVQRPEPPKELTDEQAAEWSAIVERMPADWFPRETHALLAQLCRHITTARDIARRLQSTRLGINDLNLLLAMQDRERKAMESLATKMRLTQHSRYDRKKTTGSPKTRPWE